jgi:hypothetical protein
VLEGVSERGKERKRRCVEVGLLYTTRTGDESRSVSVVRDLKFVDEVHGVSTGVKWVSGRSLTKPDRGKGKKREK